MGRAPCCDKANVKKGPWSPEEDAKLKSYIEQHGTGGNWIALPQKIGLKRCGKSCRLRWLNYLRPNIKHGGFSEEEDSIICSLYISIGSRWSIIAAQLPGRTDNDIKNYWNTRLKKKLLGKPQKEHPIVRNRATSGNNGTKSGGEGSLFLPTISNINQEYPYWPEQAVMPTIYTIQADQHGWLPDQRGQTDHVSVRKLLMNLGPDPTNHGFYNNISLSDLMGHPSSTSPPPPPPSSSSSSSSCSTLINSLVDVGPSMLGGNAVEGMNYIFSTELDELLYGNQMKLEGLDEICGSGTSTSLESLSWNDEVNPLVYQPPPFSTFNDQVHLGAQ